MGHLTDEELWSGIDRQAPDVVAHVQSCPTCRNRAAGFTQGIHAVEVATAPELPRIPARIGSYRVLNRLGEGGMGLVYEAEQENPQRPVAIKVVRGGPHVDEYRLRLFEREAQTLGLLRHPGIAAIYHGGRTDDGEHFFAMELVRGQPLTEFARTHETPRRERLELLRQVCDAINYAHQRGVIHRDLKPSNILVDADGRPKILDFGLARITDASGAFATVAHDAGRIMGTLPYMSPEEARGNPAEIDVRSDVYSLGVILYELLTDRLPHSVSRAALPEAIRVICEEPPPRPSSIDRTLRGDLETIVFKSLEKDPARRYQSAAALADDLTRFLRDEPILARPASVLYRLRKLVVRHRLAFFASAVILLGVVAVAVFLEGLESARRSSVEGLIDLNVLQVALIEDRLGDARREQGKLEEAEPPYRHALATFQRLHREDYAADTMLSLSRLLIARAERDATEADANYAEAERFLLEALDIFRTRPDGARDRQHETLELLRFLYAPERWNDEEARVQIESTLRQLERQSTPKAPNPNAPKG